MLTGKTFLSGVSPKEVWHCPSQSTRSASWPTTDRQSTRAEIKRLFAKGLSKREIAKRLKVGRTSVRRDLPPSPRDRCELRVSAEMFGPRHSSPGFQPGFWLAFLYQVRSLHSRYEWQWSFVNTHALIGIEKIHACSLNSN